MAFVVNSPGAINVELNHKRNLDVLVLENGRKGKLDIYVHIDYKYKKLKSILDKLGGIDIAIINTNWTSIDIDKRDEYGDAINFENPSKAILINASKLLLGKQLDRKFYFQLVLQSNKTITLEDYIEIELRYNQDKKIKNRIMKSLVSILIKTSLGKYKVINNQKDE